MARPMKTGLDYFPFDVDFFSDKKIRRLRARFGNDGIAVYICLLCEIYKNGYYLEYDDELAADISDELNISVNLTTQILNYLFSRSLLQVIECKLADPVKVITAESVQRRYQAAKKGSKRDIDVAAEFWVLKENETESFVKVRPKFGNSQNNDSFSEKNSDYSGEESTKESKEKKSKVKESKESASDLRPFGSNGLVLLSDEDYRQLKADYGEDILSVYIGKADKWLSKKKLNIGSCASMLREWIVKDGIQKSSFNEDKYAFVINNF